MVLPVPVAVTVTARPARGVPAASRTVAVIVLAAPTAIVVGSAVSVDWSASGGAGGGAWTSIAPEVTLVNPVRREDQRARRRGRR